MTGDRPILYVFAISHYCEKARWALDHLGIEYELRYLAPGEHAELAKKLGAPKSSVPYLAVNGNVIQGSADIIDWAEAKLQRGQSPFSTAGSEIEQRIDDVAGVHVRRYYYSEALVEHPSTVRPIFTRDLSLKNKIMITLAFGKIRKIMMSRMDLGAKQGEESKALLLGELEWIDGLLADGREYLVGDNFSRADIAVASILSPLAAPAEHPVYQRLQHPPRIANDVARWEQRPCIQWVHNMYSKHR
ncbi:MAG: glutathione S-transferase [Gammaproteobacteria bacterium]|nr:glutathione S-transferase [Gammaproteobacteria bacterium]